MKAILTSEFRKLLTIRSTYILFIFASAINVFFSLFVEGYKGVSGTPAAQATAGAYTEIMGNAIGLAMVFAAISVILFITHEYRYNTIMYTLTANVNRTKVLLGKLFVGFVFGVIYGLIAAGLALLSYHIGLSLRGATLPAQDIDMLVQLGRTVFYCAGYVLIAALIAMITRSVVAGIAIFLIVPSTAEPLLGLLLKGNAKYLPFTALDSTMSVSMVQNALSAGAAMVVSSIYLTAGLAVTWYLFVKRDAN